MKVTTTVPALTPFSPPLRFTCVPSPLFYCILQKEKFTDILCTLRRAGTAYMNITSTPLTYSAHHLSSATPNTAPPLSLLPCTCLSCVSRYWIYHFAVSLIHRVLHDTILPHRTAPFCLCLAAVRSCSAATRLLLPILFSPLMERGASLFRYRCIPHIPSAHIHHTLIVASAFSFAFYLSCVHSCSVLCVFLSWKFSSTASLEVSPPLFLGSLILILCLIFKCHCSGVRCMAHLHFSPPSPSPLPSPWCSPLPPPLGMGMTWERAMLSPRHGQVGDFYHHLLHVRTFICFRLHFTFHSSFLCYYSRYRRLFTALSLPRLLFDIVLFHHPAFSL